ncbi:hypothetical protein [Inhella sp.]|uniref:hypothetical protein n=1 Tax=Inhella sp. TaxID=1921806 RepID=UPI0035B4848A
MKPIALKTTALLAALALQACSSTARFETSQAGTQLTVRGLETVQLPHSFDLGAKATGQHEFQALGPDGKSMYGILPLRVNGGRMAVSILFFAPALALGGFRDAYPVYELDIEKGEIRYQADDSKHWRVHRISPAESERAKAFFQGCKQGPAAADCPKPGATAKAAPQG